ncbi:hypothetical protein Tco_0740257 [Tanacetum coccineum]
MILRRGVETTEVGTRGVEGPSQVLPLRVVMALTCSRGSLINWGLNRRRLVNLSLVEVTSTVLIEIGSSILVEIYNIKEGKYADILSTMSSADIDAAVNVIETIGKKFQDEVNKAGGTIDVAATFGVPLTTVGDLHKLINDIEAGKHEELLSRMTNDDRMETLDALGKKDWKRRKNGNYRAQFGQV